MIGTLVGSYKITDLIGEGGMGSVYRGVDIMLEREVAIKMLRPELSRQPNLVERFRSEAVTLAKLNHPNIATLYSFLRQRDDFFMVMEFVLGETLDSFLRRTGAMPVQPAIRLFCQALEGIDHAHQMGIIHRDIKPANMMLTAIGLIKVMDFGIARVLGTHRMTRTGHLIGTIEYMSPEHVRGEETDARSDIYSLGMLLYEMLTARLPFSAASEYELMRSQIEAAPRPPTEFAPHIPLSVEQALMRSLAKRPDSRFQTAGLFRAALQQAIGTTRSDLQAIGGTPSAGNHAPPTRLDEPTCVTPSVIVPNTRLGSAVDVDAGRFDESRPVGRPPSHYPQAAYPQPAPLYSQVPTEPAPSLLSRLNWKHYASAGALLAALIALPIVLLYGSANKPNDRQPLTGPQAAPSASPQSSSPGSAPLVGPNTPTAPIPSEGLSREPKSTATRPANLRNGRPDSKTSDGAAQPDGAERREAAEQQQGSSGESSGPQSAPDHDKRVASAPDDNQKKDKAGKIGEAAEAVGGAMKKLGGLFGGKKKDEKKKP